MRKFEPPLPDYDEYSTKQLLAIPVAIFLLAVIILVFWTAMTGVPVDRGMVFTGGSEVRVTVDAGVDDPGQEILDSISAEPDSITSVPGTDDYIVEFAQGVISSEELEEQLNANPNITINELSQISPSLGDDAQLTALYGLGLAFILMSALVIALFRSIIPAVVIILSAVSNIVVALAAMNLVGITLSMGTVGALLMLIGYSVDSDILLNTYVLKGNKSNFVNKVHDAMRTGVTMTLTSLSAMVVMFVVATLFGVGLLADMGFVLAIGLIMDLINTYMMNVSILRWYVNRGDA